jgi:pullulanase
LLGSLTVIENTAYAAEKLQVNLHYRRYSRDYEGWNVWSWVGSGQGSSYRFDGKDDYGMVASYTIEVGEGEKQIGFIVRHSTDTNEWERKDCNEDRFMDVSMAKNGVIDLYVLQDQSKFGYGAEEMNLKPKITEAALLDAVSIEFKVSAGFDST